MDIKIGYKTFKIIYQPEVRLNNKLINGYIDPQLDEIRISSTSIPSKQEQVTIHEILHGIEEVYNIKLTEKQIDALATGILSVAKDNKKLIRKLVKD